MFSPSWYRVANLRPSLRNHTQIHRHHYIEGMARAYGNLGLIYMTRGDLDQAEAMHRKALEINEKLGRLEGMARDYGNLGALYVERGDLPAAREHWLKARDLFTRAQMPHMAEKMQRWFDGLP